jgi:hypothetical protein
MSITSISSQLIIKESINTPFVAIQYISQGYHLADEQQNINTGGNWVYLNPGWIVALNDYFNFSLNYVVPIYRSLNGFQLSTSSRLIVSTSFRFK